LTRARAGQGDRDADRASRYSAREGIRLFRGQHCGGEIALQPRIVSALDYAHPADADLTDDS